MPYNELTNQAFFALLKLKAAGEYQSKFKIPQYLAKQTGRQVLGVAGREKENRSKTCSRK